MGICLILGGSKPLPGWFGALFRENGKKNGKNNRKNDKIVKSRLKKVPQSARLSVEGVVIAIWAMPK